MKRQVLFIQGGGEKVHDAWDNKLADSLATSLSDAYDVRYPRMPDEADPAYAKWSDAIRKEIAELDDGAIVVAHSIGATVLINLLAAEPASGKDLGALLLLSPPFVGDGGWETDEFTPRVPLGTYLPKGVPVHLYRGSNDDEIPASHLDLYRKAIPDALVRVLDGRDHQLNNDLSEVADDIRKLG